MYSWLIFFFNVQFDLCTFPQLTHSKRAFDSSPKNEPVKKMKKNSHHTTTEKNFAFSIQKGLLQLSSSHLILSTYLMYHRHMKSRHVNMDQTADPRVELMPLLTGDEQEVKKRGNIIFQQLGPLCIFVATRKHDNQGLETALSKVVIV